MDEEQGLSRRKYLQGVQTETQEADDEAQADHSSVAMTVIYVGKYHTANEQVKGADIMPEDH